ncbi:hypothetical protein [Aliterella atlantica]|uniref:Uncharacterized protein n=1 Tax=Aliterella atlantica CENA595 TaxID=1618023 RepID=A0A0D8ZLC8_9CYAN|nr:hypothetical protein [Aliterella atlantica]KJH69643.1 hypothetical protein UH38_22700 [Aliterella atlantica CENA595]
MIQVIFEQKEGVIIPVIACDVCNKRIEDVMQAAAVNLSILDMGKTPTKVLHVHKGKCHDLAEAQVKEQHGHYAGWEELSTHLYYLCYNLGLTPQWFEERDRQFEDDGV